MDSKRNYRVWHPVHGEAFVTAADRYWAVVEAAKEWGLRWTTIAKDCVVTDLGHASRQPVGKENRKRGNSDKKKSRNR